MSSSAPNAGWWKNAAFPPALAPPPAASFPFDPRVANAFTRGGSGERVFVTVFPMRVGRGARAYVAHGKMNAPPPV